MDKTKTKTKNKTSLIWGFKTDKLDKYSYHSLYENSTLSTHLKLT